MGTIRHWNKAAERLYGWQAAEVIGRSILDVTVPKLSRAEGEVIMQRLQAGQRWSGTFMVRRRDGSTFLAAVTDAPVLDEAGRLIGIVGVSSDFGQYVPAEADSAEPAALHGLSSPSLLTARQREVATLIAEGMTNDEIGVALCVASGTVANHVRDILARLQLRSRTEVAVWSTTQQRGANFASGPQIRRS